MNVLHFIRVHNTWVTAKEEQDGDRAAKYGDEDSFYQYYV